MPFQEAGDESPQTAGTSKTESEPRTEEDAGYAVKPTKSILSPVVSVLKNF